MLRILARMPQSGEDEPPFGLGLRAVGWLGGRGAWPVQSPGFVGPLPA